MFSDLGLFVSRMYQFKPVSSGYPVPSLCPVFSSYATFSSSGWFHLCFGLFCDL